jgi:glycosyltransferase involved in cell wall biosynthesis
VDDSKILYTPNWSTTEPIELIPATRAELALPEGRLALYAGTMGNLQNLTRLARLAAQVPTLNIAFIGSGTAQGDLQKLADAHPNVHVLPPVPKTEIGKHMASADALIVSLRDSPLLRATMPSKVQEGLASARPILAHASGDVAAVTIESEAGLVVHPTDDGAAVAALKDFANAPQATLDRWAGNARRAFDERFSAEAGRTALHRLVLTTADSAVREP